MARTQFDLAGVLPKRGLERAVLGGKEPVGITDSDLEELFVEFLDEYGLPRPRLNQAFEGDRWRDRVLLVEGWRSTRITWRQLRDERDEIAVDLRDLLGP